MRTDFVQALAEVAERDERVWLLTGDLGYGVLEPFRDRFPDRFVNAGVAEQNMIGVAAGLAHSGKIVFTYSIANFGTLRCLEQIRNDVVYHGLNVKVVSVGGGVAYGAHGYSHHAVEDLAILRSLPGMTVVAPGDPVEARSATVAVAESHGPAYLRLGKGGEPVVHPGPIDFRVGRAIEVRPGSDVTLISTGSALAIADDAAERLGAGLLSMPTVAPIDGCALFRAARTNRLLATVEEHGPVGGLFDAVVASLALQGVSTPVRRFCLAPGETHVVGSQAYLRGRSGLTGEHIASELARALVDTRAA
jgi:transketolase